MLSTEHFLRSEKSGINLASTGSIFPAVKIYTRQLIRSPRSRSSHWRPIPIYVSAWRVKAVTPPTPPPRKQMVRQGRLMTSTNISTPSLRLPPNRRGYWRNWLNPMPPSLPPTMNCRPLWPSSLNPMINSRVGLATAATTAPKGILLRLAPKQCVTIVSWNACMYQTIASS